MPKTKDQLIELIIKTLPWPQHISNIDSTLEQDAIRFDWRSSRYRLTTLLSVEEIQRGLLVSSSAAGLMSALLKLADRG